MPLDIQKTIHNYHHYIDETKLLETLKRIEDRLMALENLTAEVQATVGVIASAVALIDGLDKKIDELKAGLLTADELQQQLREGKEALANAVVAGSDNA